MSSHQTEISDSSIDPFWILNAGDIATMIGLSLTICGIVYSISISLNAKSAAIAARDAANSMKEKIFSIDAINDLNKCISLFDDTKRNIANGNIQISTERASEIRRLIAPIIHSDKVPFS